MLKARAARPSLFFSSTLLGFRTLKIKIQRSVFKVGPRLGPNWTGTRTLHGRKACFFITPMNEDRGTRAASGYIFSFLIKTHAKANKYSYIKNTSIQYVFSPLEIFCVYQVSGNITHLEDILSKCSETLNFHTFSYIFAIVIKTTRKI